MTFQAGIWGRRIPGKEISLQRYCKDVDHSGSGFSGGFKPRVSDWPLLTQFFLHVVLLGESKLLLWLTLLLFTPTGLLSKKFFKSNMFYDWLLSTCIDLLRAAIPPATPNQKHNPFNISTDHSVCLLANILTNMHTPYKELKHEIIII